MQRLFHNIRPLLLLLLLNAIGMLLIMLKGIETAGDMAILCGVMCALSLVTYIVITLCSLGDSYLFIIISMLSSVGIIMQSRINSDNGMRQMILYLLGVVCFFVVLFFYRGLHKYFKRYTLIYWGVSILLFVLTAIFGTVRYGSKNWIVIAGVSIQPSEFIRILFVLSLAAIFTNARSSSKSKKKNITDIEQKKLRKMRLCLAAAIAFSNAMCLFLQREWGIALLFFAIYLSYLYIYGESRFFFAANILMVLAAAFVGVKFMSHIQVRVETWLDPFADITGKGYQITQSLFAIGAGGFAGSGIGSGSPYFIPVVSSDFIFSAICEEMGVLGGVAILMLYFLLVYRGFKIALSSTNEFNKAVAVGLSVMLGIQTFIIVGGVTKLIPLTGITLPFISYGGSSMITTFIVMGMLQAISSVKGEVTDEIE